MSIAFSGRFARNGGLMKELTRELKNVNLKGVKRITVSFDPFGVNATTTRKFLQFISSPKVQDTNPNCTLRTNVICDRSEPNILIDLIPKVQEEHKISRVKVNAGYLSILELLELLNKHVSSLAPVEEEIRIVKTKSGKKK